MKRLLSGMLLLYALGATAAEPAAAPALEGFAGLAAERVDDPVFDGEIALYRGGKAGGEAIVLVHGLGANGARDWAKLVPELTARYEVFAFDLPGFGASEKGDGAYTPDNYIKAIEKVVAPRVGRPFILVGHSMGAALSLGYAAAYPARVTRLMLVDMAGILHGAVYADYLARNAISSRIVPENAMESVIRKMLGKLEGMPLDRLAILNMPQMRQRFLRGDPGTIAGYALANHDFSEALRGIKAPTLIVWGADDTVAPLRTGQLAASLIPGARLVVIPGAGHVPMAQQADRFNALVQEELNGKLRAEAFAMTDKSKSATQKCDGQSGLRYTGHIAKLTLIECKDVEINHARIGELRLLESEARLVDAEVVEGLYALRSRLELTGGAVAGGLALDATDIDAAGTRLTSADGPIVNNVGKLPLTLRFSVSEVKRGEKAPRYVHDFVTVAPGANW